MEKYPSVRNEKEEILDTHHTRIDRQRNVSIYLNEMKWRILAHTHTRERDYVLSYCTVDLQHLYIDITIPTYFWKKFMNFDDGTKNAKYDPSILIHNKS